MNYPGHLFVAVLLFLLAVLLFPTIFQPDPLEVLSTLPLLLVVVFSAILPDIDHPQSKASSLLERFFPPLIVLLAAALVFSPLHLSPEFFLARIYVFLLYSLAGLGLFFLFTRYLRPSHRTITLSLLALLGYTLFIFSVTTNLSLTAAAFLGYFSHLLADRHFRLF